ncbi:GGDEF domain-containing protein [Phormidium sp. CCY1219]|uniref:GGDEF domain-containing protein n=1 Tax=Phormidium sp. CCY1219 TaxID=2886104 RepID=UPI002D1EC67A|nr:GGDEF domain-containing protein [Phormidium sp. CCY1219]MEB3826249.1 GGDEF domain-containing protein [Phormidium sp. CCY1219]
MILMTKSEVKMQEEKISKERLLWKLEKLRLEVSNLKQEQTDLELSVESLSLRAQQLEYLLSQSNEKLEAEISNRQSREKTLQFVIALLLREKADLEIMLETTIEHADIVEELLHDRCIRDPLTGLFNRGYLEKSLHREISRAQQNQRSLGAIVVDVDHFKRFNDTFGHEAGDLVLCELARFLQTESRPADIVCRYGGEEFLLILPESSLQVTQNHAEYLRQQVKQLQLHYGDRPLNNITISVGVALFPQHGTTAQAVFQMADAALYRAKSQGRDRVVVAELPVFE